MRNEVEFLEPGDMNIPEVGADGDHMLEEGPGLGGAIEASLEPLFVVSQSAIDLARADGEKLSLR